MNPIGRPTSYRPEFCELACNYCLLGATNEELAGFFDVAPRTIVRVRWRPRTQRLMKQAGSEGSA